MSRVPSADLPAIVALNAPVLCFDPCAVLDIMRDPTRETIPDHEYQAAVDLLLAMETRNQLVSLAAEQVRSEFHDHVEEVAENATQALDSFCKKIARLDAVATIFGAVGRIHTGHIAGHVPRARAVVDRWMTAATTAPQSSNIVERTWKRVSRAQTPAKRGKDSMKDCIVIETYIEAISVLRSCGLTTKVVFVSSNKKDYTEHGHLKDDLATELATIQMDYAPNMAAAKHHLGL
jgi:hypothetical protein